MFSALLNFLSPEVSSTKVVDVKLDSYTRRDVCYREDGMVLYAPLDKDKNYEILLHRPYTETVNIAYGLFRSQSKDDAEIRFINFKGKVPIFVEINKELCNLTGIQRLCDTISEHPSWTVAHLAIYFSLPNCLSHCSIAPFIDKQDDNTGITPLQLAISASNVKLAQLLLNQFKCSLEHLDHSGNSVYHYAAATTKEMIVTLSASGSLNRLNWRNDNGYTPLHAACLADKPDCVKALLLAGADVNITARKREASTPGYVVDFLQDHPNKLSQQDMKFGGTPLHWSNSREVIEALLTSNCDINAQNFDERTALHVMILRNRLDCVVALLSHKADPDIGDFEGNRPIHLAVRQNHVVCIPITQSLIVFGADINAFNNNGVSARHLASLNGDATLASKLVFVLSAAGALRCGDAVTGCADACNPKGTDEGVPPPTVDTPPDRSKLDDLLALAGGARVPRGGRVLCLDGGGIRGLLLVQMLIALEDVLKAPVVGSFDWIAGTSTGGILALALASGLTLKECQCLYFRLKEHTFMGSRPYPSEPLENILKETLGTTSVMTDIAHPKLLITGVLADRKPVELHLFRNYESPMDVIGGAAVPGGPYEAPPHPSVQTMWEVGRATGAAPSYFRAFGRFLDGGLVANNPTLDALTEIHEYNVAMRSKGVPETPVRVVVSLGTGVIPVTQLNGIDVYRPESMWDGAKLLMGLSALGNLIVDQATASDGRVVDRARAWCSMIGVPYFRFSPQMSQDVALDEKNDEKLVNVLWETVVYMRNNQGLLLQLAELLHQD